MDRKEYERIQERLTSKLKRFKKDCGSNTEDAYNKGIIAAKAVVKEIFERGE